MASSQSEVIVRGGISWRKLEATQHYEEQQLPRKEARSVGLHNFQ